MTNDRLCDIIGLIGCFMLFMGGGAAFFGITLGWIICIIGIIFGILSLINYEER